MLVMVLMVDGITAKVAAVGERVDKVLFCGGCEGSGGDEGFEAGTEVRDGFIVGKGGGRCVSCGGGSGGGIGRLVLGCGFVGVVGSIELVGLKDEVR